MTVFDRDYGFDFVIEFGVDQDFDFSSVWNKSFDFVYYWDGNYVVGLYFESESDIGLDCPDYDDEDRYLLEKVSFVIEGVVQTIVAILGIFGNFLASYILCTRKEMRNAFNLLLVTMACFDSLYLFGSILESFRKPDVFNMATGTHTVLFP